RSDRPRDPAPEPSAQRFLLVVMTFLPIDRREFLARLGGGAIAVAAAGCAAPPTPVNEVVRLYIGTYTRGASRGIYRGRFDTGTGALTIDGVTEGIRNPSFLAVGLDRSKLYAV